MKISDLTGTRRIYPEEEPCFCVESRTWKLELGAAGTAELRARITHLSTLRASHAGRSRLHRGRHGSWYSARRGHRGVSSRERSLVSGDVGPDNPVSLLSIRIGKIIQAQRVSSKSQLTPHS